MNVEARSRGANLKHAQVLNLQIVRNLIGIVLLRNKKNTLMLTIS